MMVNERGRERPLSVPLLLREDHHRGPGLAVHPLDYDDRLVLVAGDEERLFAAEVEVIDHFPKTSFLSLRLDTGR